jgi:hypothetical protein
LQVLEHDANDIFPLTQGELNSGNGGNNLGRYDTSSEIGCTKSSQNLFGPFRHTSVSNAVELLLFVNVKETKLFNIPKP